MVVCPLQEDHWEEGRIPSNQIKKEDIFYENRNQI